jgi:uncharacterized protein YkwD
MTTAALLITLATAADPTVTAVNAERMRHGLKPLAQHQTLQRSATAFAHRLVRTDRFAHDTRIRVPGTRFRRLGEALAQGGPAFTPADAVRAWMGSPPHRRLLLSRRFTHAGAGAAGATVRVLHLASTS